MITGVQLQHRRKVRRRMLRGHPGWNVMLHDLCENQRREHARKGVHAGCECGLIGGDGGFKLLGTIVDPRKAWEHVKYDLLKVISHVSMHVLLHFIDGIEL